MRKIWIYIFLAVLVFLLLILPGDWYFIAKMGHYEQFNKDILIIAHRGASGLAPENTLAAIQKAMDLEADVIEIDVYPSKDSIPVVIHDAQVKRTTNGEGRITDMTAMEIAQLDAGSWFDTKYKDESVPTLEEVIELIHGEAKLLIEIKESGAEIEKKVLQLIHRHQAAKWCMVQSFHPEIIERLRSLDAEIDYQQLALGNVTLLPLHWSDGLKMGRVYQYESVSHINLFYQLVTESVIKKIHDQGKKIFVWTVNHPDDMLKLAEMGVDGIITDYPDKAALYLKPLKKHSNAYQSPDIYSENK